MSYREGWVRINPLQLAQQLFKGTCMITDAKWFVDAAGNPHVDLRIASPHIPENPDGLTVCVHVQENINVNYSLLKESNG